MKEFLKLHHLRFDHPKCTLQVPFFDKIPGKIFNEVIHPGLKIFLRTARPVGFCKIIGRFDKILFDFEIFLIFTVPYQQI